jgi:hypothetical protein
MDICLVFSAFISRVTSFFSDYNIFTIIFHPVLKDAVQGLLNAYEKTTMKESGQLRSDTHMGNSQTSGFS